MNYFLKPTIIIAIFLTLFANPLLGQQTGCYTLDNFLLGNKLGQSFSSLPGDSIGNEAGMYVTAELFYLEDNNFAFDSLTVVNDEVQSEFYHGINNLLSLRNITAKFDVFDALGEAYHIQIHGYNEGNGVNFGFNGNIPRFYENFSEVPTFLYPGVEFEAIEVPNPNGSGTYFVISIFSDTNIYEVSIGGENILIDNFCFDQNPNVDCKIYNPMNVPVCGPDNSLSLDLYVSHTPANDLLVNVSLSGIPLGVRTLSNKKIVLSNLQQLGNLPDILEVVLEEVDGNCTSTTFIRKPECTGTNPLDPCQIIDPSFSFSYCDANGDFLANLNFDTTGVTDSFQLRILSNFLETYSYSDLPITIPFNDSMDWIDVNTGLNWIAEITDIGIDSCRTSFRTNDVLLCGNDCTFSNFVVTDVSCKTSLDSFFLSFNFDTIQPLNDSFAVIVDQNFIGTFGYDQLPIQNMAIEHSGYNFHSLTVFDYTGSDIPTTCQNTINFPTLCRECPENLTAGMISPPNISGQYTFFVDMYRPANELGRFELFYDNNLIDTFSYSQLPLGQNFNCLDYSDSLKISIKDIDNANCEASTLLLINCDSVCYVPNYTTNILNCSTTNFDLNLDFNPTNNPITVRVSVNGTTVGTGSVAGSLTFQNIPLQTAGNLNILVCEIGNPNPDCCVEVEIPNPCPIPQCELEILNATPSACDADGNFIIDLEVSASNPTGSNFVIFVNGNLQTTSNYNQNLQQFQLGPFDGTVTTPFEIEIFDVLNNDCIASLDLNSPNCKPTPCSISSIEADITNCVGDNFSLDIDFEYNNVSSSFFTLFVEGEAQGFRPFNTVPFNISNLTSDGDDEISVRICDLEDNACCATILIPNICNDCEILDFQVTPQSCNTNQRFNFLLTSEINALPTDSFDVFVDRQLYTSFGFLDLPTLNSTGLLIGDFDGSILTGYTIGIASKTYNFCSKDTTLQYICPPPPSCELSNLTITDLPCDADGNYLIDIDFDRANTLSDSFNLYQNGLIYGTYHYDELSLQIGSFEGDGSTLNFLATDLIDSDCRITSSITGPQCVQPCAMSNLILQPTQCNSDGTYNLVLNFIAANPTSDRFEVYIDGSLNGTYTYADDLPLQINSLPGNDSNVDIVIRDIENIDCRISGFYQSPFCTLPCSIENFVAEAEGCDIDGNFLINIDFDLLNPVSDSFQIFINGVNNGIFLNDNTSIQMGPFPGNQSTLDFEVIDVGDQDCSATTTLVSPNCVVRSCQLWGFDATLQNCDANQEFTATIDFNYLDEGSGFELFENGISKGNFNYGSPLNVGPYPADGSTINFEIIDNEDTNCRLTGTIKSPVCNPPCDLSGLEINDTKCLGDGNFSFELKFDRQFASDSFNLSGPNGFQATYSYLEMPILVGPLNGDGTTSYPFQITDQLSSNCTIAFSIFAEDCVCEISNLIASTTACDANQKYSINLDFDVKNSGTSFLLEGNGFSQQYDYQDLSLIFGSFDGNETTNTYTVTDVSRSGCSETFDITAPLCVEPCVLSDVEITEIICDNQGSFTATIDFTHNNDLSSEFRIGQEIFTYSSLPITIGPFVGDGTTTQNLTITDLTDQACTLPLFIPANFCGANCSITNLQALVSACDSSGNFNLDLQFDFDNTNQAGFLATVNGIPVGTFSYNVPQPISLGTFPGDNVTNYNVAVFDLESSLCFSAVSLPPVNCLPCEFTELTTTITDCDANEDFSVWLRFKEQNGSSNGFTITGNGVNYGSYAYSDLPLNLGPFDGDGTSVYEFLINDIADSECNIETSIGPVDCEIDNCKIYDVSSTPTACDANGEFFVDLRLKNDDPGNDGFSVRGNGTVYGIFSYGALPIRLGPFVGDGNTDYEFIISDVEKSDCVNYTTIGSIDCNITDCSITDLNIELLDCNGDGTYQVEVDFKYENETNTTFDLSTTRGLFGTYNLSDLPLTITDFPINGNPFDAIRVCMTDSHICCASSFFPAPDCDGACIEFELLSAGMIFDSISETVIVENDVLVQTNSLFTGTSVMNYDSVIVEEANQFFDASIGLQITTLNATVDFDFPNFPGVPCREVTLNYYQSGNLNNISVNDQPIQIFTNFEDIPYTIGNGVNVEVFPVNSREGSIKLKGFIRQLKIGGSNLSIDNICYNECQNLTSVWPGDINTDNLVSNLDILNLGVAFGAVGPMRDEFNVNWEELSSEDWLRNFGRGVNFKHSDCNGDGIIDKNDLEVMEANYGLSNDPILTFPPEIPPPTAPRIYIEYPDPSTIEPNVPFTMNVMLAEESNPIFNLYGLAFNLRYDNTSIQILQDVTYPPSWYGDQNNDLVTIDKVFNSAGVANIGMTRINQENVTGYGMIAQIDGIIIVEDIVQRQGRIDIEIDGIASISKDELSVPINGTVSTLGFEPSSTIQTFDGSLEVFPNPTNDKFYFEIDNEQKIDLIEILSADGKVLQSLIPKANYVSLDQHLPGIYIVKFVIDGNQYYDKVVKQ